MLTQERLSVAQPTQKRLSHWGDHDPLHAAELVRRDVLGLGTCLPMVWFSGGVLVPVVTWNLEALESRAASGRGPILSRAILADRLEHGRDHVEPAVLEMAGFIALWPLKSARNSLAVGSAYGPAIAAVPLPPGAGGWEVFECDYYGYTVAEVDRDGARVVVEGLNTARYPHRIVGHQKRLMEEQFFDIALRTGTVPGL